MLLNIVLIKQVIVYHFNSINAGVEACSTNVTCLHRHYITGIQYVTGIPYVTGIQYITGIPYRMGINFQGVLNLVDFVGLLHPRKMLARAPCTCVKTMHAVAICHKNINPQNRLTFSNHVN